MFNINKRMSGVRRTKTHIMVDGRKIPIAPFKPHYINVTAYAAVRECSKLLEDHPWLVNIKLYENPQLMESLVQADYNSLTIEMSTDLMEESLAIQRDVFIRVVCKFLDQRFFGEMDEGESYRLLVQRYSAKTVTTSRNQNRNVQ